MSERGGVPLIAPVLSLLIVSMFSSLIHQLTFLSNGVVSSNGYFFLLAVDDNGIFFAFDLESYERTEEER